MMKSLVTELKIFYFLSIFIALHCSLSGNQSYIEVEKHNVLHKFVPIDPDTDHFTRNVFSYWEEDTFNVFEQVKDANGIAIDLGAWIGTTSIWLSKNFRHVVAVDGDVESLRCLKLNLEASECRNVTIFDKPIDQIAQNVVFGSRGAVLNQSISYIKDYSDSAFDYATKSITFKQLIHDAVYADENLNGYEISFIKCDIEGGEESILEDVLHFAYYNKCPVYMSFHIDWWKSKKISDFNYLFKYFNVANISIGNVSEFLASNPFASLLLVPKEDAGELLKENITAVIIGYNQYTYIKNMVSQLEKYTKDIVVIDNASDYEPLLNYYENDFKYSLLRQKVNYGHSVYYTQDWLKKLTGDVFILTDPDLEFNPKLPDNFISELINISNYYQTSKVGFALLIDSDDIRPEITHIGYSVKDWESQFWQNRLFYEPNPDLELYSAAIDTTFCLINRKYSNPHIRVAGNFTCVHIPWHINYLSNLEKDEYERYLQNNISTSWFR